jgi:hypothetical protein
MEQERNIRAVVTEGYLITEDEQQMILAYRGADASTKRAVKRILDTDEEDDDI